MPKVSDLFEIYSGSNLVLMDLEEDPNGVNFVANSGTDNGISSRVVCPRDIQCFDAGLISVSCNGSILASFVQPEPFITGVNMKVLKPKTSVSDTEKWFYCYCLRENSKYYSYGRKADRYLKDIELPDKIPDWVYGCKLDLPKTEVDSKIPELHTENWKSFKLGDLFDIEIGEYGSIPDYSDYPESTVVNFVGKSSDNCGVITKLNLPLLMRYHDQGNITVSMDGVVGNVNLQTDRFITFHNVAVLHQRCNVSAFAKLFLCCVIHHISWRFNNVRKWNMQRMLSTEIKLPTTSTGEPDWNFMELYMKSLPYSDLLKDI